MKKLQKSFTVICLLFLFLGPTMPSVNVYAKENSISYSTNADAIVKSLMELHPEFSESDIRRAVNQAMNNQPVTLPRDPSQKGTSFRGTWQGITTGQLAFAINLAISLVTGGVVANLATKLSTSALSSVRYSISAELAKWGASAWGAAFIETALQVADPGSFIANSIDSIDFYPNNRRINLWK